MLITAWLVFVALPLRTGEFFAVMPYAIGQLIDEVSSILEELDAVSEQAAETLREIPSSRRRHAENMMHYAHLRTIDIRGVQNALHDLGVTSLTTAESFTRGRLELALNVLQALEGVPSDIDVASVMHADEEADEQLRTQRQRHVWRRTRGRTSSYYGHPSR